MEHQISHVIQDSYFLETRGYKQEGVDAAAVLVIVVVEKRVVMKYYLVQSTLSI